MASPEFEISYQKADESREIARIHVSLIPGTPLSNLGVEFLEHFYYRKMIEEEGFICLVAKFNGKIVGFIAAILNQKQVFLGCVKKNFGYFSFMVLRLLLTPSLSIGSLLSALKIVLSRDKNFRHLKAKLLSLAVLPEYRSRKFLKTHRTRIASKLFYACVRLLQEKGIREFKIMVLKSNLLAIAFYNIMGLPIRGETRLSQGEAWVYLGNTRSITEDKFE